MMDDKVLQEIRARSFGTGIDNPYGLQLTIEKDGEIYRARYRPKTEHLGFPSAIHGGITSALLDEIMAHPAIQSADGFCATRELHIRYRSPLLTSNAYVNLEAWLVSRGAEGFESAGRILSQEGKLIAEGSGTYKEVAADRLERFMGEAGKPS